MREPPSMSLPSQPAPQPPAAPSAGASAGASPARFTAEFTAESSGAAAPPAAASKTASETATGTRPGAGREADFARSAALARVARGNLCAGCGACAGIAPGRIGMEMTPPGYLRPRQSASLAPEQEALIAAACPGLGQAVQAGGRADDPLWGPYLGMRTGWARDPQIRHGGSSGGGLTAVLIHLLASGQIDAVVQTAADPDNPTGNRQVISTTAAEVLAAAGSRYAPSSPLADLAARAADGRRYAFVGKPCDVAALRALIAAEPRYGASFPVLLSFFCAGVPSQTGAHQVLKALGTGPEAVTAFRYRGHGWPGLATATLASGETRQMSYHDSWGKVLSKHVQHRCKICADGTGIAADLVCADAWETDAKGYPLFENAEGISLIVTRSARGAEILTGAEAAGALETRDFAVPDLTAIQPGQRERRRALAARLSALKLTGRPVPRYRGLRIWEAARQNSLEKLGRNFLGMLRRALQGRV